MPIFLLIRVIIYHHGFFFLGESDNFLMSVSFSKQKEEGGALYGENANGQKKKKNLFFFS